MSQSDSTLPTPNSLTNRRTVPDPPSDAPYVPSDVEKANYYYGLPSKPRLIARSSSNVWMKPTGPEAYLVPKELTPLGPHRLNAVWEQTVGPAMDRYPGERGSVHQYEPTSRRHSRPTFHSRRHPCRSHLWLSLFRARLSRSLPISDLSFSRMELTMSTSKTANPSSPALRPCTNLASAVTLPPSSASPSPLP